MLSGLGWAKEEFKTLWIHRTWMGVEAGLASALEKEPALEQPWAAAQAPPSRATRSWVEPLAGGESLGKMGGAAVWGLPGVGAGGEAGGGPCFCRACGQPSPCWRIQA